MKFAFSGDSSHTRGNHFDVLKAIELEKPDFFFYLGDTVYADSKVRGDSRDAYRTNREVPALRDLLRSTAVYAAWGDPEVQRGRGTFLKYMPVLAPVTTQDGCASMFRTVRWGAVAEFFLLDARSCRTASAVAECTTAGAPRADLAPLLPSVYRLTLGQPAAPPDGCIAELHRPERSMLGKVQLARFLEALTATTATFKFVMSEVAMSQLVAYPYDRWDGYAAERAEVLGYIRDRDIRNVIFLTADLRANLSQDVKINRFSDPLTVAREYITGPIAAEKLQAQLKKVGGISAETVDRYRHLMETECLELNSFVYGLVEVDAQGSTVTVTLKNEHGEALSKGGCRENISAQK